MGLFDKIKNVLFEEEEIEVPVTPKEEKPEPVKEKKEKVSIWTRKEEPKVELPKEDFSETGETEVFGATPKKSVVVPDFEQKEDTKEIEILERDVFASKQTFEFPVFDESDFNDTDKITRSNSNVLEHERHEKKSRKLDFGKYDTPKKEDDVKTFKPSPVISPVYGLVEVDKDLPRENVIQANKPQKKKIDIDVARNRAFGTLEDEINHGIVDEITEDASEETEYEEIKPSKTIDDLLMDSIDETITVGDLEEATGEISIEDEISLDTEEIDLPQNRVKEQDNDLEKTLNILNQIESELDNQKVSKEKLENDTLESDLFSLIDSMYDDREDGE